MSWKQLMAVLTLVVAMFSTVVIVSTSYNVSGFERVEGRIKQLESVLGGRIDRLENRIEQLENRVHRLDDKIDGLSNEVAEIKGALKAKKIMANR